MAHLAHLAVWRFVTLFLRQTDRPQPIMQRQPSNPTSTLAGTIADSSL